MTYWDDRAKEIIKDETLSDKEMSLEIERIINNMINDIENEISKFYARYADSEGISISEAKKKIDNFDVQSFACLLYTSPSPRDLSTSRMPSSA